MDQRVADALLNAVALPKGSGTREDMHGPSEEIVREAEQALETFGARSRPNVKSSHEAIAEQASAIIKRAHSLISEELDGLQRQLDELRVSLYKSTEVAEDSIHHAMRVMGEASNISAGIKQQIEEFRAQVAKATR